MRPDPLSRRGFLGVVSGVPRVLDAAVGYTGGQAKDVTEITPASTFYRAEEYHQRCDDKHGLAGCHLP